MHDVRITTPGVGSTPLAAANDNGGRSACCARRARARCSAGKASERSLGFGEGRPAMNETASFGLSKILLGVLLVNSLNDLEDLGRVRVDD